MYRPSAIPKAMKIKQRERAAPGEFHDPGCAARQTKVSSGSRIAGNRNANQAPLTGTFPSGYTGAFCVASFSMIARLKSGMSFGLREVTQLPSCTTG